MVQNMMSQITTMIERRFTTSTKRKIDNTETRNEYEEDNQERDKYNGIEEER